MQHAVPKGLRQGAARTTLAYIGIYSADKYGYLTVCYEWTMRTLIGRTFDFWKAVWNGVVYCQSCAFPVRFPLSVRSLVTGFPSFVSRESTGCCFFSSGSSTLDSCFLPRVNVNFAACKIQDAVKIQYASPWFVFVFHQAKMKHLTSRSGTSQILMFWWVRKPKIPILINLRASKRD